MPCSVGALLGVVRDLRPDDGERDARRSRAVVAGVGPSAGITGRLVPVGMVVGAVIVGHRGEGYARRPGSMA